MQGFPWSRALGGRCIVPGPKSQTAAVAAEVVEELNAVDLYHMTQISIPHEGRRWLRRQGPSALVLGWVADVSLIWSMLALRNMIN